MKVYIYIYIYLNILNLSIQVTMKYFFIILALSLLSQFYFIQFDLLFYNVIHVFIKCEKTF